MYTFSTPNTYRVTHLVKEVSVLIGFAVLIYIAVFIWTPERISTFSLAVPSMLVLMDIYDRARRHRLQQVVFDNNNCEIVLYFKSLTSPIQQKKIPFDAASIEVITQSSKWKVFESMTLNFMKGKREVFQATKSKDGFSLEMFDEIVQMAEQYSIRIIRK